MADRKTASRKSRSRYKAQERRFAKWIGGVRTPLSGGNSRHTRGDTIHPVFYTELKGAQGSSGTNGWVWKMAHLDPNQPLLVMGDPGLVLVHSSMLAYRGRMREWTPPARLHPHWAEVAEQAAAEGKIPVCAFFLFRKRGWWVMAPLETLRILEREVQNAEAK